MSRTQENKKEKKILNANANVTRRQALSKMGTAAIGAGAVIVVGGVAYYLSTSQAPPSPPPVTTTTTQAATSSAATTSAAEFATWGDVYPDQWSTKYAGTTLTYYAEPDTYGWFGKTMLPQFTKLTGINVNNISVAWDDQATKDLTVLQSKGDVDLFCNGTGGSLDVLIAGGYVEPLDDYLAKTPEWANGIAKSMLADAMDTKNTHTYVLPQWIWIQVMCKHNGHLAEAGINSDPETWDDLLKNCLDIKKKGIVKYPFVTSLGREYYTSVHTQLFVRSFKGPFFNGDGDPVFNTHPNTLGALQFLVDCIHKYQIMDPAASGWFEDDSWRNWEEGSGVYAQFTNIMTVVQNDPSVSKMAGQGGAMLVPGANGQRSAANGGTTGCCIAASSKNKDAAWELAKFRTSRQVTYDYNAVAGEVSAWPEVMTSPAMLKANPSLDVIAKQYDYFYSQIRLPWKSEWDDQFVTEIQNLLQLRKTVKQAMNDLADFYNKKRKEYGVGYIPSQDELNQFPPT